jgi:hypothetical protein
MSEYLLQSLRERKQARGLLDIAIKFVECFRCKFLSFQFQVAPILKKEHRRAFGQQLFEQLSNMNLAKRNFDISPDKPFVPNLSPCRKNLSLCSATDFVRS